MTWTMEKPVTPGEVLLTHFMQPTGITQARLAEATGWSRKHVNQICQGTAAVSVEAALILAEIFGTSPHFWLDLQKRVDLWNMLNSDKCRDRMKRLRPLAAA